MVRVTAMVVAVVGLDMIRGRAYGSHVVVATVMIGHKKHNQA